MPRIIHEDEREDARIGGANRRSIHPALLRLYWPEPKTCRACGFEPYDELTEDGLCSECDAIIRELEKGKIS